MVVPSLGALAEHEIGGGDAAGRRHVLHHDGRIAGNMLAEMARRRARLQIVSAADAGADDEGDLLAGIKILLGRGRSDGAASAPAATKATRPSGAETAIDSIEHFQRLRSFRAAQRRADFKPRRTAPQPTSPGKTATFRRICCDVLPLAPIGFIRPAWRGASSSTKAPPGWRCGRGGSRCSRLRQPCCRSSSCIRDCWRCAPRW